MKERRFELQGDTRGHDAIREDTPARRFGTVRPPAPDQFRVQNRRFWTSSAVAGAQPGHRFLENVATRLRSLSR